MKRTMSDPEAKDSRTCIVCRCTKVAEQFPKNGKDAFGIQQYRKDCRDCYNITRKATCKKGRKVHKKFVDSMKNRTGEVATITLAEWKHCMIYFKGRCAYCGIPQSRTIKITKDHVVPCVLGGTTGVDNIVPACKKCNASKGSKQLVDWYPYVGWYSHSRLEMIESYLKEVRK